ncbi:hypothetical protein CONLIGDRAFT_370492 [Coniochaeta ligniaria NRRL 30616]|uniref:Uncharacterized protein n=1 Tax=Coniochaeta ligniaria NRRL 30616 TaxID=1408157 RepID=A0A1J7ILW8_9PEZI|nr:hypothetical protein CONLIGDRAFT_370492 [Coniochaeta ligniaria NRRL 30616]
MFVIDASSPKAHGHSGPIRQLQASIETTSPFTPKSWICPQCSTNNPIDSAHCRSPTCTPQPTRPRTLLDQRGRPLDAARFPVSWICSTCCLPHHLLDILLRKPDCACGRPTLQAVYDQFGDLFLFWQDDPGVRDLRDRAKVEEAARRLWAAGGDRWVDEMPVIRLREEGVVEVEERPMM